MKNDYITVGEYIDSYLPVIDGVIVCVQNYARYLNQNHCNCYVATAESPKGYVDKDPFQVIRYHSLPVPNRPPYRFGIPLLDFSFEAVQYQLKADLVHTHSPFIAGREALRFARSLNIPIIASFHTKYYEDILQVTNSRFLSDQVIKLIVDYYNSVDYVWTVNHSTAKTLREYGYEKTLEIIPNGADFIRPKNRLQAKDEINRMFNLSPNDNVVLFVGQHILQKNLIMLLDAVTLSKSQGLNLKLLMVGDGYAKEQLIEHAQSIGIGDIVTFAGNIEDRETLSKIYVRADVFAFPSIYDTYGLVVLEAAAAQCPSIVVQGSNVAEQCQKGINAFFCENNARSLADSIREAFQNEEYRREVGLHASKTIARAWEDVIKDVYKRYEQIISNHPKKRKAR